MTLESRLSKLEASILPEVRPAEGRDDSGVTETARTGMRREIATSRPIPRTGVLPSWFSSGHSRDFSEKRRALNFTTG